MADNAVEVLNEASVDAGDAKILFLLLGIPGVLVAGALGLSTESALAEANRREDALLRLRGATEGQLVRLAVANAVAAGVVGTVLGLLVAAAAVSAVIGHAVWRDASTEDLVVAALLGLLAGALTTAARLIVRLRAARRADVVAERQLVRPGWRPLWLRARLDLVAIAVGVAILAIDAASGGLHQTPIQGPSVALSFYVLLAPIALWLGLTLLGGPRPARHRRPSRGVRARPAARHVAGGRHALAGPAPGAHRGRARCSGSWPSPSPPR